MTPDQVFPSPRGELFSQSGNTIPGVSPAAVSSSFHPLAGNCLAKVQYGRARKWSHPHGFHPLAGNCLAKVRG